MASTDEKVGCFLFVVWAFFALVSLATSVGVLYLIYLGIKALS